MDAILSKKKSQHFFQSSHEYGDNSASIALGFIQIASGEPEKSCLSAPHLLFGPPTLTAENFLNSQHIKENFINFCNTIEKTKLKKTFLNSYYSISTKNKDLKLK